MNSTGSTFLTGLNRVISSAKVQTAISTLVPAYFAIRYAAADLGPNQKAALWIAFLAAFSVLVREILAGWSAEDVAAKTPAAPTMQVNSADQQTITPTPASITTPQTPTKP
jgi:hypothetical protein